MTIFLEISCHNPIFFHLINAFHGKGNVLDVCLGSFLSSSSALPFVKVLDDTGNSANETRNEMTLTTLSELGEIFRETHDTERCVQCYAKRLLAILEKQKRKDSCQPSVASRFAKAAANDLFLIHPLWM